MPIRKNTLFTVPLYCLVMGFLCFYLVIYGVARFAIVTLPDGSVASNDSRVLLIHGLLMAAVLLLGGLLFRRMTKKELAVSAAIMAALHVAALLILYLFSPSDSLSASLSRFTLLAGEWSNFIGLLLYRLTGSSPVSTVICAFMPFLFVLSGKNE